MHKPEIAEKFWRKIDFWVWGLQKNDYNDDLKEFLASG
jgi:hypothetical protein